MGSLALSITDVRPDPTPGSATGKTTAGADPSRVKFSFPEPISRMRYDPRPGHVPLIERTGLRWVPHGLASMRAAPLPGVSTDALPRRRA